MISNDSLSINLQFHQDQYSPSWYPNQALHSKDPIPDKVIRENPEALGQLLSQGERDVLNFLFALQGKYATIYVSQSTLANGTHLCRQHVNVVINRLTKLGVIMKDYRYLKTCIYRVSSMFLQQQIRDHLLPIFSSFKYFPVQSIAPIAPLDRDPTQLDQSYLVKSLSLHLSINKDKDKRSYSLPNESDKHRSLYLYKQKNAGPEFALENDEIYDEVYNTEELNNYPQPQSSGFVRIGDIGNRQSVDYGRRNAPTFLEPESNEVNESEVNFTIDWEAMDELQALLKNGGSNEH